MLKLLKFILVTRFSRGFLAFILVMLVYSIAISFLISHDQASKQFNSSTSLYLPFFLSLMALVSILGGGILVTKSDLDYLFTLPIERSQIALSLFIAQFIGTTGVITLFTIPYIIELSTGNYEYLMLNVMDLIAFSLFLTSLTVVSGKLNNLSRILFGSLISLWFISPIFDFKLTPVSVFSGNLTVGNIFLLPLTFISLILSSRTLMNAKMSIFRTLSVGGGGEFKKELSFKGVKSPLGAVMKYNFSTIEFAARVSMGGASSYRAARLKISSLILVFAILALIYIVLILVFKPTGDADKVFSGSPWIIILYTYLGAFIPVLFGQASASNERAWLAFTSIEPAKYLRYLMITKALIVFFMLIPFSIANILLVLLGFKFLTNALFLTLLQTPLLTIVYTFLVLKLNPIQVKEVGTLPNQLNLRQFLVVLPFVVIYVPMVLSVIFLYVAIASSLFLLSLSLFFLRKSTLKRLALNMVEKGFV